MAKIERMAEGDTLLCNGIEVFLADHDVEECGFTVSVSDDGELEACV